jgi:hypothetical protein
VLATVANLWQHQQQHGKAQDVLAAATPVPTDTHTTSAEPVCTLEVTFLPFSLFRFWHFLSHSTHYPASTATTSASHATHHDPKTQKAKREKGKRVSKQFVVSEV